MTAPAPIYDQVYAEYLDKVRDPVWKFAMEVFLGELMQQNAAYHQAQIQAIADWAAERQLNRFRSQITKRYLIERLSQVNKSRPEGEEFNALWQRDADGRFVRYTGAGAAHAFPRVGTPAEGIGQSNVRSIIAQEMARRTPQEREAEYSVRGLIHSPQELPAGVPQTQHAVDVANLFDKLTWNLANKTGNKDDKQRVQFVISTPEGYHRIETPKAGEMPNVDIPGGERVSFMTPVGPDHPVSIAGQAVNIGHVAGMNPEHAAKAGAVAQDINDALNTASWGQRLQHTANALRVVTDNHPVATQAHAVATLFNILGPSANRAFGNKLKQLFYRYRGQEAAPENYSPIAKRGRGVAADGHLQSIRDYERQLAYDLAPSIPSSTQFNLAMQSGGTPPSRGYILNDQGRVVSEAVGYSDDWYTPFNLRKLPQMRGGSYIRTRAYGGLTPEDIRVAMRTGAKRVTVISNNGVFTMEFNPKALHWGHRFGFAGNGMIRRYHKALDALKNRSVSRPDGPGGHMQLDTAGYTAAMHDLQLKNPYYIKPETPDEPFHQSLRDFGQIDRAEATGDEAVDHGYLSPVDVHAPEAVAGWHTPKLRDLFSTDLQGNPRPYTYDEVRQAQLHHNHAYGLINDLHRVGTPAVGAATTAVTGGSGPSNPGSHGVVPEGWYYVDQDGLRRDHQSMLVDEQGNRFTGSGDERRLKAVNMRNRLRNNGKDHVTRPGFKGQFGSTVPRITEDAQDARAAEQREKSHHLDPDTAQALAEKTRMHLDRTRAMGLLPDSTSAYPHLDRARKALEADPNSEQYKNFVHQLQTSDLERHGLAMDLHDLLESTSLMQEGEDEDPEFTLTGLLAELGDAHKRKEGSVKEAVAADVAAGAVPHGDPEYVLTNHEFENSRYLTSHIDELAARAQAGDEKASQELAEYRTYRAMQRKVENARKQQVASGRSPSSIDKLLRNHSDAEREFFRAQNRKYGAMIKHGAEHPDAGSDSGAHTHAVGPTKTYGLNVQGINQGLTADRLAQIHYDRMRQDGLSGPALNNSLEELANQYWSQARSAEKSIHPHVKNKAEVYREIGFHLDDLRTNRD